VKRWLKTLNQSPLKKMASGDMPQEANFEALAPVIPGWSFATSTNWFHNISFGYSISGWLIQIRINHVNEVFDRKAAEREFILKVGAVCPVPVLLLVKDLAYPWVLLSFMSLPQRIKLFKSLSSGLESSPQNANSTSYRGRPQTCPRRLHIQPLSTQNS
jgi:1,4-dihydroxy-2-naphthoate octaprenyltransferase